MAEATHGLLLAAFFSPKKQSKTRKAPKPKPALPLFQNTKYRI
jgi:hypothetical protein